MFVPMLASLLGQAASPLISMVTKKIGDAVPNVLPALTGNIGNIVEGGLKSISSGKAADLIGPISKLAVETLDGPSRAFLNPSGVPIPKLAETPHSVNSMMADKALNLNTQIAHIRNNNAANLRPVSYGYDTGKENVTPSEQYSDNLNNVAPAKNVVSATRAKTGSEIDSKKKIPKLRLVKQRK